MAVIGMEAHRVVAIPAIHHCLLHVWWDLTGQLEGGLDGEGLSFGVFVERLIIYGSSWVSISLGSYHHP